MLFNIIKISFRAFKKDWLQRIINIAGLTIGISCFLLIYLFVTDELSYDRFHENAESTYRLMKQDASSIQNGDDPLHYGGIASALTSELTGVESIVQIYNPEPEVLVTAKGESALRKGFLKVDATFFEVFDFELAAGDPDRVLKNPNSMVLTVDMAERLFGDDDPIGEEIIIEEENRYTVTGIAKPVPQNSHFRFTMLASTGIVPGQNSNTAPSGNLRRANRFIYLVLSNDRSPKQIEQQLPGLVERVLGPEESDKIAYYLQPLTDIHLYSDARVELGANSNYMYIYIFSAVALFILIIACINYVNLATARSLYRAHEVGIKKAAGAGKKDLFYQFMGESFMHTVLAVAGALLLVEWLLPGFNDITSKSLDIHYFEAAGYGWLIVGITIVVGLASGLYPSLYLSNFQASEVLRGPITGSDGSFGLRKVLVTFQLVITIVLIFSTLVVQSQLDFIRNSRLSIDKEKIVMVETNYKIPAEDDAFISSMQALGGVRQISRSPDMPGGFTLITRATPVDPGRPEAPVRARIAWVGYDFLSTFNLSLVEGRDFSSERGDDINGVIVNEAAADAFGWENAVGRQIEWARRKLTIIGVVNNYHFDTLRDRIEPLILQINKKFPAAYYAVRVQTESVSRTLEQMNNVWESFETGRPFSYTFLDDAFDRLYRSDQKMARVFRIFSLVSIFLACTGLFSLVSFSVARRTKEISIRKILGADVTNILGLLTRDFFYILLAGFLVAVPLGWYLMNRWLADFSYRIEIGPGIILFSAGAAVLIVMGTVSWQAVRSALANPVDSLRTE